MIRKILHTFWMVALVLGCLSCVREELATPVGGASGGEGWLMLDFGVNKQVSVQTKATLPEYAEGRVLDMYVVVFDKDGNKLSSGFFDASDLMSSVDEVSKGDRNCWSVSNPKSAADETKSATGRVLMKCAAGTGLKVYVIANLDSDMAKVSSDLLSSTIHYEYDIQEFEVFLNQTTLSRNGYFPMTCKVDGVDISAPTKGNTTRTDIGGVQLERIDSKIKFIFKTGNTPDAKGQTIEKFEARQWKVVNVPRKSYLLSYKDRGVTESCGHDIVNVDPNTSSDDYSKYAAGFFTTDFVNFEEFPKDGSAEFSFYMMENRQKPKKTLTNYQDRSRAIKDEKGLNKSCQVSYTLNGVDYTRDMRMFEYANDFSTYVVVTGYVTMRLHDDEAGKVLGGEVEYLIHLGDWRETEGRIDNYNIERNTSYTYTVTINSLNSIRVEVETSQKGQTFTETQPGATGQISIAKEEIALCDCHYESKTISFHLSNFFKNGKINKENCIVDELTWSVKTPFGEGEPKNVNGVESVTGLDYQWVHFRLNKRDTDGNYYSDKRRKYTDREFAASETWRSAQENAEEDGSGAGLAGFHNDGIMTVPYLCKYIKEQVNKYVDNEVSDFDKGTSKDDGPKISLTVFVDEFYYDKNPVTSETRSDLWKYFVNKDDRKLHILCNSVKSLDEESSMTGSVVTIQQSSIQCVYNTDPSYTDLETAWGVENKDEDAGSLVQGVYWSVQSKDDRHNDDQFNGLYNSCKEWGLSPANGSSDFTTGLLWTEYMNYEVDNSTPQLNNKYKYMRYACMNRNRDNNGDGKIDRNEVRWYLASIRQLVGMYVGDGLLNSKTKLYNKNADDRNSTIQSVWQQHVVSSTMNNTNSNDPTILWAEEGVSTGEFYQNYGEKGTEVRCVRNLGYIGGESNESYTIDEKPEDYIKREKRTDGSYLFTCTHLNELALRYYTSKELIYSDERSQENRLYKKFECYNGPSSIDAAHQYFKSYNDAVTDGMAKGTGNPYCPKGYRTPSQIEAAIMRYYIGKLNTMTRTYWSFGPYGSNKKFTDVKQKPGFIVNGTNVTVSRIQTSTVRCVRDVRTD